MDTTVLSEGDKQVRSVDDLGEDDGKNGDIDEGERQLGSVYAGGEGQDQDQAKIMIGLDPQTPCEAAASV